MGEYELKLRIDINYILRATERLYHTFTYLMLHDDAASCPLWVYTSPSSSALAQKLAISIQLPRNASAGPFSPSMTSANSAKLNRPGPPRSLSSASSMSSAA